MTSKVEVDAHAGWPISVTQITTDAEGNATGKTYETVVEPGHKMTFYVHSTMAPHIRELSMPQPVDTSTTPPKESV
jgi:hypothetical protein